MVGPLLHTYRYPYCTQPQPAWQLTCTRCLASTRAAAAASSAALAASAAASCCSCRASRGAGGELQGGWM